MKNSMRMLYVMTGIMFLTDNDILAEYSGAVCLTLNSNGGENVSSTGFCKS